MMILFGAKIQASPVYASHENIYNSVDKNTNIPASIDLGLSVKWSSCNWGADAPWDYGTMYGWGAPASNSIYGENYPKQSDIVNTEYDIVSVDWGHGYRMPSRAELRELVEKCQWDYTTIHNVKGYKVTGPNGNTIFIPASGYLDKGENKEVGQRTFIWSSEQYSSQNAYSLHIHEYGEFISYTPKYEGLSLRGVTTDNVDGRYPTLDWCEDSNIPASIDLGLSVKWSSVNWGADAPWDYGTMYGWGAPASNSIYGENYPQQSDIVNTEYDIVSVNWGHGYRMPSKAELRELVEKCQWDYTTIHDVKGYKVTGPNGNSIFIPASGYLDKGENKEVGQRTFIWSSEQYSSQNAYSLHIHEYGEFISYTPKYEGLSLRGVTTDIVNGRYPTLEDDSGIPEMFEPTATDNWIKVTPAGVTLDIENGENTHLYIHNMQGILVKNISITPGIHFCISVDNTILPQGLYIIKVLSGKHEITKKFVIR